MLEYADAVSHVTETPVIESVVFCSRRLYSVKLPQQLVVQLSISPMENNPLQMAAKSLEFGALIAEYV